MTTNYLYINNIDKCVDNVFDTFYQELLNNLKLKKNIINIDYIFNNFNSILESINNILLNSVNIFKLKDFLHTDYDIVIEIIHKYTLLYIFFNLIIHHKLNDIIILLNKLKKIYKLDFFNNKYITQYAIYYKTITDYYNVFNNLSKIGLNENDVKDEEFINNYIEIINRIKLYDINIISNINKDEIIHNILKIVIFGDIYIKEDKIIIFKIIENTQLKNVEFKYIEIIDSKFDIIDYSIIETLFSAIEIKKGISKDIFDLINDYEFKKMSLDYDINFKINILFDNKILIPITDDFLRFHKEADIFESQYNDTKIDLKYRTNKKDNTKIKYIITKVNKVKDFYLDKNQADKENKDDILKIFYQPLIYRKLILIDDIEEINIIHKLELQDISLLQNNTSYNDLLNIRNYAYNEFKYLNKDYLSFSTNNTINAIRYCNFEYKYDIRFENLKSDILQSRIINNRTKVNIIGIALPTSNFLNNYNYTAIRCIKLINTFDIKTINKNSYLVAIQLLKDIFLKNTKYVKLLYWIFERKNDIIQLNLFDNITGISTDDYIKILLGSIYDLMVNIVYKLSINQISKLQNFDIDDCKNIIKNMEKKLVFIPRSSIYYTKLMKYIYHIKAISNVNINDSNEEYLLQKNIIKLPQIILEKKKLHIIIIKKKDILDIYDDNNIYENYTCQHIVTWNNILKIKKHDTNKFNQDLYNFIKNYIIVNNDSDFLCKSCFQMVDIKKYTTEIYPGSTSITITYGLDIDLDTIQEYIKFSKSIKNIEKTIEKICHGTNIIYYTGPDQQTKFRRQEIVKNIIDIVTLQYNTLYSKDSNIRKLRISNVIKYYGCTLTNFFLFKLENDIFTFSSKEIDKFKMYKLNNIYIYILINLILELNLSQILNLTFDKTINYFIFNKYAFSIFNKLYIRTTMSNKLVPITDYKLLCYVIYYIGGFFIKYNMWFIENIETKKNIINLKILQYIIHTFIDAMNTIIENNNKNYLYEIYSIKFFNKLNTVYNNINILNTLNAINNKKITIVNNIFKFNIKKIIPIPIEQYDFNKNLLLSSFFSTPKYGPYPTINIIYNKFTDLSFEKIIGKKILNEERNKLINNSLLNIAKLYNLDGTKRKTKLSDIEVINSKYTIDELQSIQNNSERIRLDSINSVLNKIKQKKDKIESQNLESIKLVEELNKIYNKDTDILISSFINKLNDIIGNNNEINILHNIYSLNHNVYIIDHNFLGTKIKPIIINNDDNVIKIKINDNIFKQDIYIYEDASKNISYYSFIEKNLMAYKEYLKEIVFIYNTNCYIKINYSIKYQLKLLGFNYIFNKINYDITNDNSESFNLSTNKNKSYIEIESKKIKQKKNTQEIINKDLDNIHETDKNIIRSIENVTDDSFIIDKYEKNINNLNKFINNILRIRLQNLKNCLSEIQQIIYQIKFQLTSSSLNYIAKLFQSKINYLNTYDDNNNRIFKDWILINNSTYHINYAKDKIKINIKSLSNNNKYIHSEDIIKLVSNCDIILYYIIEQLNLLLDINDDNYIKFNIAYIIINLIIYLFNNYTKNESVLNDINVKKFYLHIINNAEASNFSDEIDITQMTEEELDNFNDEQSNIQEELDAIDADQDEINEDFGDEEILLVDRTSGEY